MKLSGMVRWCKVYEPDTKFQPQWSLDLYPPEKVIEKLEAQNYAVKENDDGEKFIKVKLNVTAKSGATNEAPRVVAKDGKTPFTELIGNGSEVNVLAFDYGYKGVKYLGLKAVQVTTHVPYGEDFDDLSYDENEFSGDEEEF